LNQEEFKTNAIVTLDFETYYDKDYSLSKLTTEEYIRSSDFEVIGLGVQIGDEPKQHWSTGSDVASVLGFLNLSQRAVLAHNTAFDGAILMWRYGILPKYLLDTLSMARPWHRVDVGGSLAALSNYYSLGTKGDEVVAAKGKRLADFTPEELEQYGRYCCNDVELTYKLFIKLLERFPPPEAGFELDMIDLTLRMYVDPVMEIDTDCLDRYIAGVRDHKAQLVRRSGLPVTTLQSNVKFADFLWSQGVEPPTKTSKTTGFKTFALAKTDDGFKKLLDNSSLSVRLAAEARLAVKSTLHETRAKSLIDVSFRGPLPVMLNYYGAHTGRFSGGDKLNLQNLPKRGGDVELRRSLQAPDGHVLLACDLSQIEARVLAWLAGEVSLLAGFAEGSDVYSEFIAKAMSLDTVSKEDRFIGKTCILGLGYGMGSARLQDTLRNMGAEITEATAQGLVKSYRTTYAAISNLWSTLDRYLSEVKPAFQIKFLETPGYKFRTSSTFDADLEETTLRILLPNKLPLTYNRFDCLDNSPTYHPTYVSTNTELRKARDKVDYRPTDLYGGKLAENLVQALASLLIRDQMLRIYEIVGIRPALQVHDELVYVVLEDDLEYMANAVAGEMRLSRGQMEISPGADHWSAGIPLDCEASIGLNYGDLKEIDV